MARKIESGFTPLDFALEEARKKNKGFIPRQALDLPAFAVLKSNPLDHESFTDGGGASATIDVGFDVPAGALVLAWAYEIIENVAVAGASGETGYTLTLGDGTDADRFDPVTDPSETIASQNTGVQLVAPLGGAGGSGDGVLLAATAVATPTLTLTLTGGTPDAGNFVAAGGAGKFYIYAIYLDLSALITWKNDAV